MVVTIRKFIALNCASLSNRKALHLTIDFASIYGGSKANNGTCLILPGANKHTCHSYLQSERNKVVYLSSRFNSTSKGKIVGKFREIRILLREFFLGGKSLYEDVKITLKVQRKLRTNSWDYTSLERKELSKMIETQKNLKKTLPIVALSLIPIIGYLGPLIGFMRPRQFLSSHFWTEKQKEKYLVIDAEERKMCRSKILKILKDKCKEHQEFVESIDENAINSSLLEKNFFIFSRGKFTLQNLDRGHLKLLCTFFLMRSWWPTFMLRKNLAKEMWLLHLEDIALTREGIENLNKEEIDKACHARGLDATKFSNGDSKTWLLSWLKLTKNVSELETSYLAHLAVF